MCQNNLPMFFNDNPNNFEFELNKIPTPSFVKDTILLNLCYDKKKRVIYQNSLPMFINDIQIILNLN